MAMPAPLDSTPASRRRGPLVVATMVSSCGVKAPPDTAAIKEQALPALQTPAQWAVTTAPGVGAVVEGWLLAFNDEQLTAAVNEAIAHNADLRVGATRVEQALLHARLAGARLYPSVDLLARGGGKLSGDGSGIQGGVLSASWELDLWAPRSLRTRRERRASRLGAGGLRLRTGVDCRAGRQELDPRHRARAAGRRGARHHPRE